MGQPVGTRRARRLGPSFLTHVHTPDGLLLENRANVAFIIVARDAVPRSVEEVRLLDAKLGW